MGAGLRMWSLTVTVMKGRFGLDSACFAMAAVSASRTPVHSSSGGTCTLTTFGELAVLCDRVCVRSGPFSTMVGEQEQEWVCHDDRGFKHSKEEMERCHTQS